MLDLDDLKAKLDTCGPTPTGQFLLWLADRLVLLYGESQHVDFVQSLRRRALVIAEATDESLTPYYKREFGINDAEFKTHDELELIAGVLMPSRDRLHPAGFKIIDHDTYTISPELYSEIKEGDLPKRLVQPDAHFIDEDEAIELTLHHLRLAAMFFTATPEDGGVALKEEYNRLIRREILLHDGASDWLPVEHPAIVAFIDRLSSDYDKLKKDDWIEPNG